MRGAQVSPHEFLQQVMAASAKKFTIEKKADPLEFLSWLLNTIHADLTGGRRKKPSIISKCFQASHTAPLLLCIQVQTGLQGRFCLSIPRLWSRLISVNCCRLRLEMPAPC